MAERSSKGGRYKLSDAERQRAKAAQTVERNTSEETITERPDGYHFSEEVTSEATDSFKVEEAPKARTEDQVIAPSVNLSPDSLQLASLALGVTNSAVVVMFGQECGLYDNEKKLLYPSLSRVINRMPASSAAKASVFIDPLVLLFGLAVWVNRIAAIKSKQRAEANTVTAREFASASGIHWDASAGPKPPDESVRVEPPGTPGNGTVRAVQETGPVADNANGVVGKVPDIIIDSTNTDITGGN